jgi:hypothetical protein
MPIMMPPYELVSLPFSPALLPHAASQSKKRNLLSLDHLTHNNQLRSD